MSAMTTPTLTEFLRDRFADTEALARAAKDDSPTPWANDGGTLKDATNTTLAGYCGEETAAHIVRHDPARVLADVEAKRRIVEECYVADCIEDDLSVVMEMSRATPYVGVRIIHLLALPYADHPDFREEWRV